MNSNLIEHFLNKKQIAIDSFLIQNVNYDNVSEIFNSIFKSDWAYEILKIEEDKNTSSTYMIIAVYVPGKVITSMVTGKVELSMLLNKALKKALVDYSAMYENEEVNEKTNQDEGIKEETPLEQTNIDDIEKSINNIPKNEYGIRQDQIDFINNFKAKYSIDSDEKFNHYIQTWSDNNIYEISNKKELVLAGEKIVDEFIKWISIASSNSIVSPM